MAAGDEIQQIKDRINIVDVVGQYVQLRRAGRTYMARCPFHKERTPSFHVSPERGTYKCFGCGEGGDIFTFVEKMDGIDFATALKMLAEKAGVTLTNRAPSKSPEEKDKEERLREVCDAAVSYFESQLAKRTDVHNYLTTRGAHDETIKSWRIGYAPATWDSLSKHLQSLGFKNEEIADAGFGVVSERRPGEVFDRFRGRIMFPIFDAAGQPIAVSGRFFELVPGQKQEGEPAKYVNSPETLIFKKSRVLYGFDRARMAIRKADCILLVEGQFDLILSHQSGLPFTVALSGTALTPEHLSLLGRLSKRLVLALDGDEAGIRAGLKSALMAIGGGFEVKIPTFAPGKDPADIARENPELLRAAIRTSKPAVEFFLDTLRPGARDELAYAKAVRTQVLPLVNALPSALEQEHFDRLIAGRLGVSPEAVRADRTKLPKVVEVVGEDSLQLHAKDGESTLSPLHKKVGMVLFGWTEGRAKLTELLGPERLHKIEDEVSAMAETLRFEFDREVGEHSSEATIAGDMLEQVRTTLTRERYKMKAL
ncbi:MAG TPA: DNA primase [Candidatus Paceibacterota bacterium]